ncbi:Nudix hydrolase domain-containing protein [Podarcis lilfordi]|uniref:Nudix hydrolase domain-containing protein n=2 Tax=Podarcis lilfordi TaxID=74358 RepID=A0AA35LKT4_9SAUR|nr:Nudix hydrolase domain-containing protein [Podarcis lilfordi]
MPFCETVNDFLPGGGGREVPLDGQSRQKMDPDISLLFQCPSPKGITEAQVVMEDAALEGPVRHQDLPGESVVKELFCSVLREIQDEVNLPLPTLSSPMLLGIARNETSAGRCSAEFYIRCSLSSEQVRHHYAIGGPEAQESTSIIFVDREDVLTMEQSGDFWKELCPSAKGAIELYRGVMGTCQ